jgi:hypothetical protein
MLMIRCIAWMQLLLVLAWHPVHVSVSNVEYDKTSMSFHVSFKVFSDDFNFLMAHYYGTDLAGGKVVQDSIDAYFNYMFSFRVNDGTKLSMDFINSKSNEEATWYYYQTEKCTGINRVSITNTILLDLYSDQTNLLIFKYKDYESGFQFNGFQTEVTFQTKGDTEEIKK